MHFDVMGGEFVRVFVRKKNTNKNARCFCVVMISFELPGPKRRSHRWIEKIGRGMVHSDMLSMQEYLSKNATSTYVRDVTMPIRIL